jgi:hypothetical protein
MRGKIDKLPVDAFFPAQEMALNFNKNIFPTKGVDKKLCAIGETLGSARASRTVSGALAGNSSAGSIPFGEAPNGAREGACAPRNRHALILCSPFVI